MLEGQLSGSALFNTSFYKNTKAIRNDKRHKIVVKDDIVTLQMLAIDAGDAGKYQCTVENEVGKSSCDCEMTLKGWRENLTFKYISVHFGILSVKMFFAFPPIEPPSFAQKIENMNSLCQPLRLECKVKGSPSLRMQWYKNGTKITDGDNYRQSFVDSTAVLELRTTRFDDNGVYTCEATNDAGSISCSTTLRVKG
uniref:Ig-like domain-containing protein n=1 Tax=Oncorhynchus kisutch TaxID=8019 RepID=A0A8C7JRT7_ONCKI